MTGVKHKLLWLQGDPAFEVLRVMLPQDLPGRLAID